MSGGRSKRFHSLTLSQRIRAGGRARLTMNVEGEREAKHTALLGFNPEINHLGRNNRLNAKNRLAMVRKTLRSIFEGNLGGDV